MLSLLGGIFLGWSLGANDAANVFGTAVSSKMVRFRTAAVLAAVFVIIGAVISGRAGIMTLKGLTALELEQAVISSVAAAITVTLMTFLRLPVSTSQSVVGSIIGIGILNQQLNLSGLGKVVACWIGTPLGAALMAVLIYLVVGRLYNRLDLNLFQSDAAIRVLMILTGIYGAYALGANNVANVTAVFVGAGLIGVPLAAWVGGISIAGGILTFSRPVMETVGNKLVRLDPLSALIVAFALAGTVHFYSWVGVPVSSSQAVVGGVLGIGLVKGTNTVSRRTLYQILIAWIVTPMIAAFFALFIHFVIHLRYVP
jgi:PiT family inorganic phosphate transporter